MVNNSTRKPIAYDSPAIYQISVQGTIDPDWSDRLQGMQVSPVCLAGDSQLTNLTGELSDQAALFGVLNTLYDLHMTVISINRVGK